MTRLARSATARLKHWLPAPSRIALRERWRNAQRALLIKRNLNTADQRALPAFIVMGAQKAGTSSFYGYLGQHPRIVRAVTKEIHYFDLHYAKGPRWYRAHFPLAARLEAKDAMTGEASPYYMAHPHAVSRILNDLPGVKLIALLRNPVDRVVSHYFHERRHGTERLSLADAIKAEEQRTSGEWAAMLQNPDYNSAAHRRFSYLARSDYAAQLRPLMPLLDGGQLLLIKAEELFECPAETMQHALRFLGLEPPDQPLKFPVLNQGEGARISAEERALITAMLDRSTRELEALTGIRWD